MITLLVMSCAGRGTPPDWLGSKKTGYETLVASLCAGSSLMGTWIGAHEELSQLPRRQLGSEADELVWHNATRMLPVLEKFCDCTNTYWSSRRSFAGATSTEGQGESLHGMVAVQPRLPSLWQTGAAPMVVGERWMRASGPGLTTPTTTAASTTAATMSSFHARVTRCEGAGRDGEEGDACRGLRVRRCYQAPPPVRRGSRHSVPTSCDCAAWTCCSGVFSS